MLGIIGGSSFLKSKLASNLEEFFVDVHLVKLGAVDAVDEETPVRLYNGKIGATAFIFAQRHKADPNVAYSQPGRINKRAIVAALKQAGCTRVLGFGSVGSLHASLPTGTLLVPDDYVNHWAPMSFYGDARAHIAPGMDAAFRARVVAALHTVPNVPASSLRTAAGITYV
jgi:purine nucleoside phosphorylase